MVISNPLQGARLLTGLATCGQCLFGLRPAFAAICTRLLGLKGDELTGILKYLNDFGYETTDAQAADMLADLSETRKREILDHLAIVAKADGEVDERERRLFEATAKRLGFS